MAARINQIRMADLKLEKEIGRGGFGTVYQMKWTKEDGEMQVAAKKFYNPDDHELDILSKLDHPNIVKLLGVVDEGINFLLILELCEGGSLRAYLDNQHRNRLPMDGFYSFAKQVSAPIQYLKQKHVVHKDVKSPNILITRENTLKLADFGLAKNIDSSISNATVTASYPWMAPELLKNFKLSPSYDIFALAVVIWELWTLQYPFKGLEPQVIAWQVCSENKRLPIPDDMPLPLADLLRRCWDADWHKRPSIEEVISVISTAASTPPPVAAAPIAVAAAPMTIPPVIAAFHEAWQRKFVNGPWMLEKRFGQDGPGKLGLVWDIAVNPNGDVAVLEMDAGQVKVFNSDGQYKLTVNTTHGMEPGSKSHPHVVTVSSDGGTYYMTNTTQYVKMYDVNGGFKGQWISSCPQASSFTPELKGLAMDQAKDEVLVGDVQSKHINRHRQDGIYIASIKVGIKPLYLAIAKTSQETIIVADYNSTPQIISNAGQVLYTLRHPTDGLHWVPFGVYCYKDIILINNRTQSFLCEIVCYSLSGTFLGHIPIDHALLPMNLALTVDATKLIVGFGSNGCATYVLQQ